MNVTNNIITTKPTLWTFGDSFTSRFSEKIDWCGDYIKWKGYAPLVYSDIISESLSMNVSNLGVSGSDNYTILQTICDTIWKIKPNDIVIIGWSSPLRFRMVSEYNDWRTYIPAEINFKEPLIAEILVNRDNDIYALEVRSWIRLIDSAFPNNKVIHWTPFDSNITDNYISGEDYPTITMETNGELVDFHFSEEGQIRLANKLMELIKEEKPKRIKRII
jgi:hypothetical protein